MVKKDQRPRIKNKSQGFEPAHPDLRLSLPPSALCSAAPPPPSPRHRRVPAPLPHLSFSPSLSLVSPLLSLSLSPSPLHLRRSPNLRMGPPVDSFLLCSRSLVTKNGILAQRSVVSRPIFLPIFPRKLRDPSFHCLRGKTHLSILNGFRYYSISLNYSNFPFEQTDFIIKFLKLSP